MKHQHIICMIFIATLVAGLHATRGSTRCMVPVSVGDCVDKITILRIKRERIVDPTKHAHILEELHILETQYTAALPERTELLTPYEDALYECNLQLWDLEDAVRRCEQQSIFDYTFALKVDAIIEANDRRATIKRAINNITGSAIIEEKSYEHIGIETTYEDIHRQAMQQTPNIIVESSLGDLADRITILTIKCSRLTNPAKREHALQEHAVLSALFDRVAPKSPCIDQCLQELLATNQAMWDVQDALRMAKSTEQFDNDFIELGRAVYRINDKRCAIKRQLDTYCGSIIIEEKQYAHY